MSILKSVGSKAKEAASAAASKSQDMMEIGKLKKKITTLEGLIKEAKMKIGEMAFDALAEGVDMPQEEIKGIYDEISQENRI